jgi:hypothetical protein
VAAADLQDPDGRTASRTRRSGWLAATIGLTLLPMVLAVTLAPGADEPASRALVWLLFVGSSVHVGATGWFYTVHEVRDHMRAHAARYLWIPVGLVTGSAALAVLVPASAITVLLVGFFAWQFFHFQKQNLGIAALAGRALAVASLSRIERAALTSAGIGGIAWLVGHPALLQLAPGGRGTSLAVAHGVLSVGGAVVFVTSVMAGGVAVARRPSADRPIAFVTVYVVSLLFFAPVFCFASPYAAVAGLTIAHGLQYLLLMGLIAGSSTATTPARDGMLVFLNVALLLGLAINQASHMHTRTSPLAHPLYGAYLGVVMAHFVIDAGLWRLRDEFPRAFLTQRLPYLLAR